MIFLGPPDFYTTSILYKINYLNSIFYVAINWVPYSLLENMISNCIINTGIVVMYVKHLCFLKG